MISVIQHTQAEYLGLIEDHLEGRGLRFKYFRPFTAGGGLPHRDLIRDGLVLLPGGPWGSAGERDVPTIAEEVALARAALMYESPVIGFGLGAQILALAAGGGADRAPLRFEIVRAERAKPSALEGYLPAAFPAVLYMRDFPVPPDYAIVLAFDAVGRPIVWQIGACAFGFACHPGVKSAMIEDLIMEFEEVADATGPTLEGLRRLQPEIEDALVPIMTGLVRATGWMAK